MDKKNAYLLVGNGRLASHLAKYFDQLDLPLLQWNRRDHSINDLKSLCEENVETVLLAISDNALESFIQENPFLKEKKLVHFSGCLSLSGILGAHPLMSFSENQLLENYQSIPFVIDFSPQIFKQVFPQLENPTYSINPEQKPHYHSLCVMAGNFTVLLWQKFFSEMQEQFNIPHQAGENYLNAITQNLVQSPATALTGPFVRNDQQTINKNLQSLENDPYQTVYQSFLQAYQKTNSQSSKSGVLQ